MRSQFIYTHGVCVMFSATANKSEGNFEKAPVGTHPAVLVGIFDLGEQWVEPFGDESEEGREAKAKWQRRLYYVYELVTKQRAGMHGNHLIAIDLTFSMNEKAKMRKWVEARTGEKIPDGTSYDVANELGKPVLLTVEKKGDFPRITDVAGITQGETVSAPLTKLMAWKLDPARLDEVPSWVPYLYGRKITDVMRDSRQIKGERTMQSAHYEVEEEIPF